MNPEVTLTTARWARLRDAFADAAARPAAQQADAVAYLAHDDPSLAGMLGELLAAQRQDSSTTTERSAHWLGEAVELLDGVAAGTRVGGFVLRERLGRGGMGVVYLAERVDGHVSQRAALKLVPRGRLDDDALRQFRRERDVIASLRHPNIAQLLDAGETADGVPYFVMELVDGQPLARWCSERRAELRTRLALFLRVCEAVQYAHANLVLHRDLKPGNILVTTDGTPKLIDFGVAKVLPRDLAAADDETRQTFLTPANAAPEQLRAERSTVSADVYQLGTVLYELLTGTPVFSGTPVAQLEQAVLHRDPEPPSRRLAAATGTQIPFPARSLRGDLDAIVLKTLRKEPARRYASAAQLAQDIEAWLGSRPVQARRGRAAYRLSRFVRRNRMAVIAGAFSLAVVLVGIASTVRQMTIAQAERSRADQTSAFLVEAFRSVDPAETLQPDRSIGEVVGNAIRRVDLGETLDPRLAAEFRAVLGDVSYNTHQHAQALRLLQASQASFDADPATPPQRLARNLLLLANAHFDLGDPDAAVRAAERGLDVLRRAVLGGDLRIDLELARIRSALQRVSRKSAIPAYRQLLAEARTDPAATDDARGRVARQLGSVLSNERDASAGPVYDEAVALLTRAHGPRHPEVLDTRRSRADFIDYVLEDSAAARAEIDAVLAVEREVLGPRSRAVAQSMVTKSNVCSGEGKPEESVALLREARDIIIERAGAHSQDLMAIAYNLASDLEEMGRFDEALASAREAEALAIAALGADSGNVQAVRKTIARLEQRRRESTPAPGL